MSPAPPGPDLGLVRRVNRDDDEDEEQFKPLEWGLIRRLFTYAAPVRRKFNAALRLTVIRSAQLPALVWAMGAHHRVRSRGGDLRLALGGARLRAARADDRRAVPLPAALRARDRRDGRQRPARRHLSRRPSGSR
jgi:hypothetical protein